MGYGYKWKPSKTKAREFARAMDEIADFCTKNGIHQSARGDSYYFTVDGVDYRVSNHTIEASNRRAYDAETGEQIRPEYHPNGRDAETVYIFAGKTRIREIYADIVAGYKLDARGNRIE